MDENNLRKTSYATEHFNSFLFFDLDYINSKWLKKQGEIQLILQIYPDNYFVA
jgi:hypothetical protein